MTVSPSPNHGPSIVLPGDHCVVRAALVMPVSSPPIPNGCVEIWEGRVLAVHDRPPVDAINLGEVALLPGLINAHTHLEFSDHSQPLGPARPFTAWLESVMSDRRRRGTDRTQALRLGATEAASSGTAAIGEIATSSWTCSAFPPDAPMTVAFHESLGISPERQQAALTAARDFLAANHGPGVIAALSPHAPYSVHPELLRALVKLAVRNGVAVAMHLAESPAELQLLHDGTGEFVELLTRLGVWDSRAIPPGRRIRDYLEDLSAAPRVLVVHGNFLEKPEIDYLADRDNFSVVYCPRTHAYFGHGTHPFRELLERGVRVVLGTDSRASNPDLSVWNEARFLAEHYPDLPRDTLLKMITLDAAEALGLDPDLGSIEPGKQARFAAVPLSEGVFRFAGAAVGCEARPQPR